LGLVQKTKRIHYCPRRVSLVVPTFCTCVSNVAKVGRSRLLVHEKDVKLPKKLAFLTLGIKHRSIELKEPKTQTTKERGFTS
jgi:hypothetical protein